MFLFIMHHASNLLGCLYICSYVPFRQAPTTVIMVIERSSVRYYDN